MTTAELTPSRMPTNIKVYIYKFGNSWLMDTTTKVGNQEIPITVSPSRQELALWFELQRLHTK